jgi:hypothetical protein
LGASERLPLQKALGAMSELESQLGICGAGFHCMVFFPPDRRLFRAAIISCRENEGRARFGRRGVERSVFLSG